jgi:hypothetical protein
MAEEMAEESDEEPNEAAPPRHRRDGGTRAKVVGVVAGVVRGVGLLFAVVLAVHVLLTVGGANPDNVITRFFDGAAQPLALAFTDLFTPADPKLRVLVNHGIAALFWLIVSGVAARLIRKLA